VKPTSLRTTACASTLRRVSGATKRSNTFPMVNSWDLSSDRVGMRQCFVWYQLFAGMKSRSRRLGLETASRLDFDCLGLVSVSEKIGKVSPRSRLGLERKGLVCIPTADNFWENGANVSVTVADTELFGL